VEVGVIEKNVKVNSDLVRLAEESFDIGVGRDKSIILLGKNTSYAIPFRTIQRIKVNEIGHTSICFEGGELKIYSESNGIRALRHYLLPFYH